MLEYALGCRIFLHERADMRISEVAEKFGISIHTLRYYEKLGLIQRIIRKGGKREYAEEDLGWIEFIQRLKATGMPLSRIRVYSDLRYRGDSTISERKRLLQEHQQQLEQELVELELNLQMLRKKITLYDEMEKKNGTV